ncbi:MAG: DUF4214 domain-containing protein [Pikeienuella sp.]
MQRNPVWTDEDATTFLSFLDEDDGALEDFVFAPSAESAADAEGVVVGTVTAGSDSLDAVAVELQQFGLYTFLAIAETAEGAALPTISIFDDEGFLLLSTDSGELGIEDPLSDTIWQFAPSYTGTHYVTVGLADPAATGNYALAGEVVFGDVNPADGNTEPLATDNPATADSFEAIRLDPIADDIDADADELQLVEIFSRVIDGEDGPVEVPIQGVVFFDDGTLVYRPRADFEGLETFGYRVADPSGASDIGFVTIEVAAGVPFAEGTVSKPDAQRVALLYEAGLNREGNIDTAGLNFWIEALAGERDGQTFEPLSFTEIASFFIASDEFAQAFGPVDELTDDEYVEQLYQNVLNRPSDPEGFEFWSSVLEINDGSRELLLLAFTDSTENLLGTPEVADIAYLDQDGDGSFDWVV